MENKGNLALSTVNRLPLNDYYFTTPLLKTETDGVNALKMVSFFSYHFPRTITFRTAPTGSNMPGT